MEKKVRPSRGAASAPPPVEVSAGLHATVQVGGAFWWLRRVRFYADGTARRFTATAYLERRPDQQGDPLEPSHRPGVELRGDGPTLGAAALRLVEELTRPNVLLLDDRGEG